MPCGSKGVAVRPNIVNKAIESSPDSDSIGLPTSGEFFDPTGSENERILSQAKGKANCGGQCPALQSLLSYYLATTKRGDNMYTEIRTVLRYSIALENVSEVKELLYKLITVVKQDDPGTLSYEFFLDEKRGDLYLLGRWRDSEALIAHEALLSDDPIVKRFHEMARPDRIEAFGQMSEDLQNMFPDLQSFPHLVGFTR
jgi:quinol monooxygenase YgiN